MFSLLALFSIFACVFSSAPWPQYRHDAQHTSFVNQSVSSKYSCKSSVSWIVENEFVGLTVNNNVSYTLLFESNLLSFISLDSNGKNSTIFPNLNVEALSSTPALSQDGSILYLQNGDLSAYRTSDYSRIWNYVMTYTEFLKSQLQVSKSGIVFFAYATQQWTNSALFAVVNGTLLWELNTDILGDMVLSLDEQTIYFTSFVLHSQNFTLSAVSVSNATLLWSLTFPNSSGSGDLLVNGDGNILLNTRPPFSSLADINSYSYYVVNPLTRTFTIGFPASLVSAVKGNAFYIRQIGAVSPAPLYYFQISNIYQVENGNILNTWNVPVPNEGDVRVVVTQDIVFATSVSNNSAYLLAFRNSSNATVLASRATKYYVHSIALSANGDIIWFIPFEAIAQVSTCSGYGACSEGTCTCNKGREGKNCDQCINSKFFNKSGETCEKKTLNGLGIFVIIILPFGALIGIIAIIIPVRTRMHRHHGYKVVN